jgi:hypothetical protein
LIVLAAEEALWTATACDGLALMPNPFAMSGIDRDTIGAIVGGIVVCATGNDGIPILWPEATEPVPGCEQSLHSPGEP